MDATIAFFVATAISFWGSIQLGLVNVAVIETTLNKDARHAFVLALGGILPEIPYTLLAVYATDYVQLMEDNNALMSYIIGAVFILLGLYYFLRKPPSPKLHDDKPKFKKTGEFFKGFGLASLNPQLIIYWSGILIFLKSASFGTTDGALINFEASGWISPKISFALGAAFGALLILSLYIYLAQRFKHRISAKWTARLNLFIGGFFVLLGLYSIIDALFVS